MTVRALINDRIVSIVAAFDAHDPGILDGIYQCPTACGWRGTETQWHTHLAKAIGDALVMETVELPWTFDSFQLARHGSVTNQ
jgi:hypothetical protein